jgi:hypothetical protein
MKLVLRIVVMVFASVICLIALWPGKGKRSPAEESITSNVPAPAKTLTPAQQQVRNALGGAALDAGRRAKDQLESIQKERAVQLDQVDSFSSETSKPSAR